MITKEAKYIFVNRSHIYLCTEVSIAEVYFLAHKKELWQLGGIMALQNAAIIGNTVIKEALGY